MNNIEISDSNIEISDSNIENTDDSMVWNIEDELVAFSKFRPITLILPSLFSELEGPALPKIVKEISKVKYLNHPWHEALLKWLAPPKRPRPPLLFQRSRWISPHLRFAHLGIAFCVSPLAELAKLTNQ